MRDAEYDPPDRVPASGDPGWQDFHTPHPGHLAEPNGDEAGANPTGALPYAAEIDGEATAMSPTTPGSIGDPGHSCVAASLGVSCIQVEPGGAVELPVAVANRGPATATFSLDVTALAGVHWCVDLPWAVDLGPGEQTVVHLTFQPPRQPDIQAGEYPITLIVDSPDYPGHCAVLPLTLAILPYDAVDVAITTPPRRALTWLRRRTTLGCAISNGGNRPVTIRLRGRSQEDRCRFDYRLGGGATTAHAVLGLGPGERTEVAVGVTLDHVPLAGRGMTPLPVALTATPDENPAAGARARLALAVQPLVGPWQLAALAGIGLAGMLTALVLVALIVAGQLRPGVPIAADSGAATAPLAPPLYPPPVIIVNLPAPLPERLPAAAAPPAAQEVQPDPRLPLVLPGQVTAPGSGGPLRRALPGDDLGSVTPAAAPQTTGNTGSMTYSQMFQEIGLRYDLDWRLLAALAYVESGFDVMALSSAGAMGLMQVLPETWREWAPAVDAADPFDAYANTLVAATYLDHLRTQLAQDGRIEPQWMLVAYNWGPDRLKEFLASGNAWESLPEARRQYAADVLRIAKTIP
jgi:soluble lytic murein transglycosylase-like protein